MLIGLDKVLDWARDNGCIYWKILSSQNGYIIYALNDKSEITNIEDSVNILRERLQMLTDGNYFIEGSYPKISNNSHFKSKFLLNGNNPAMPIGQINQPAPIDIEAKILEGIEKYKTGEELARLKIENQELRTQLDGATNRILGRVEPYLGQILQGIFPQVPNVSGIQQNNSIEPMNADEQKLQKALEAWSNKDTDFLTLIEKISQLASSDPATYNMAKGILLNK